MAKAVSKVPLKDRNEIKAGGGKAAPNFGSVSSYEDCLGMVQQARDEFDGCHIIFNPAGILRDRMFHKMSPDDWQAVMDVHLNGHFNTARAAINLFREQEYGRIIMVGSTSGLLGNIGQANYGAAKLGIAGLSRIVAMENTSKNVTSNVDLSLGRHTNDPFGADTEGPDAAAQREERLRLSPADAIAPLCTFLASEEASHVTGQIFHQRGAELSLYSQPRPIRTTTRIWVGRSRRSATKRCRRWRRISSISRIPVTSTQDCRWNKHKLRIRREGAAEKFAALILLSFFDICATATAPSGSRRVSMHNHAPA